MESNKQIKEKKIMQLMMLPLSFVLGIIPLIVRMKQIEPKDDIQARVLHVGEFYDCFSQNKAYVLLITSVVMLVIWFFFLDKNYFKVNNYIKVALCGAGIYLVGTVLSTILSEHKEVALYGTYDRAEGLITLCCYVFVFMYSIYAFNEYKDIKFVIVPISLVVICNAVLGVYQYVGRDLYIQSDWMKQIIVPESLAECREDLAISYPDGTMYGTLGHYNYMGSFTAMLTPFFLALTIGVKGEVKKVGLGFVLLVGTILLLGNSARSGLVGAAVAIFILLIVLGKKIVEHWKIGISIIVIFVVLIIGLNFVSSGSIFARVPSLLKDITQVIDIGGEKEDYRDYLPIREFKNENGEAILILQDEELHFKVLEDKVVPFDKEGHQIPYAITESDIIMGSTYQTEEAAFSNIKYNLKSYYINEEDVDCLVIQTVNQGERQHVKFICRIDYKQDNLQQIDEWTGEDVYEETAPSFGFKGSELLGSSRGYIWSRTLPMLKNTLLIGKGPENFFAYFTRHDSLAKLWAYDDYKAVVDKAHDLYLQIAFNQGGLALIGFLILVGSYMIQCFKLYALKTTYDDNKFIGIALMVGVVGYLAAGIFNDSAVSVAPIFWVLLGLGYAVNAKQDKEQKLEKGYRA